MGSGRSNRPTRTIAALCGAAAITVSGLLVAPTGFAEPTPTLAEAKKQVDELGERAEIATERANEAREDLKDVQRQLAQAQANVERQQARVTELTKQLGGFAAATYRSGALDPTIEIFLADNPEDFLAQASIVDVYADQQTSQLQKVASERQLLAEQKALADEELARLRAIEKKLAEQRATADKLLDDAEKVLSKLKAEDRARYEAERQAALDRASRDASRDRQVYSNVPASGRGKIVVDFALAQLGEPYVFGADGPDSWDCSGLTKEAWERAGVSLEHSSRRQYYQGPRISKSSLAPGDLVFFYSDIHHVGIYLGNGKIIHAPRPGKVVEIIPMDYMPYYGATRPG